MSIVVVMEMYIAVYGKHHVGNQESRKSDRKALLFALIQFKSVCFDVVYSCVAWHF